MVELRDEDEGRVALVMDKEELPFAVEALLRVGYELTPPSEIDAESPGAEDEQSEGDAEQPEEEPEEPEAAAEDIEDEPEDEPEDDPEEDAEEEPEKPRGKSRRSRSR